MRAALFESYGGPVQVRELPAPEAITGSVLVRVAATGLCRSDWHGWRGHDPDIALPHVPGHELAGTVEAIGPGVERWRGGERVTVPFVAGCGDCPPCSAGDPQVCNHQSQPGFTHWGSFAELVRVDYADGNLVALPASVDFATAASLGCRYTTAFRAVAHQGRLRAGEWLAVHGCGGVGLSAVQIGVALDARVVAVDIRPEALAQAKAFGAVATIDAREHDDVGAAVRDATDSGAHISLDALGSPTTCVNSIESLRKRGRHVQVGLLVDGHESTAVPMAKTIAWELEILGSHGMQAARFGELFELIAAGRLDPGALVVRSVGLEEGARRLMEMDGFGADAGITVIEPAR